MPQDPKPTCRRDSVLERGEARLRVRPLEVGVQKRGRLALIARHEVPVAVVGDGHGCVPMYAASALALTPAAIIRLAKVWRASWRVIGSSPIRHQA